MHYINPTHLATPQECDITLLPGNLYCLQGESVYCQSHYHDDSTVRTTPPHNLYLKQALGEGELERTKDDTAIDQVCLR